jgi:hypothetical protein
MGITVTRRFVYGTFVWPGKRKTPFIPSAPARRTADIALEIVQEYSATELLGKIYVIGLGGRWTALTQAQAAEKPWHKWFMKTHRFLYFDMEGSGWWQVLHFRIESDDAGQYVAAALRYGPPQSIPKGLRQFYSP